MMPKYIVFVLVYYLFMCCYKCDTTRIFQNEIKDQDQQGLKWPNKEESSNDKESHVDFSFEDINNATNSDEFPDSHQTTTIDNIQFRESKSQPTATSPNVYFTKTQTKEHVAIHYPNIPSNPNNRLQLEPEDAATLASVIATTTPQPSSHFNFFADIGGMKQIPVRNTTNDLIKSMEITLDIVKHSFWEDQNVIFSPLSVINILALLLLGAEGRTVDELSTVLRLKASEEQMIDSYKILMFHKSYQKLRGYLSYKTGKDISIEMANEIFTDKHFLLENNYVTNSQEFYDTPVKSFNFGKDGKLFQDQVNQWVREKTKGKILSIIDKAPSPDTVMALVNAVHFKGNWEIPFTEKITRLTPFHVKSNETIQVQMMTNVLTIPYFENEHFQMIAIPYKGNQTGFFACLPKGLNGIEGLKLLEKRLSILQPKDLENRVKQMMPQKVAVKIPKMKIDTDGHMEEILKSMGSPSMFQPEWANFTKISENGGLYVSSVHHRAMIEVNERGTEAAAVTLATGDRIIEDPPIPFIANKPFMFFIYHIRAKSVLFWGRVTRPQWT